MFARDLHDSSILHLNDTNPIVIRAGGDVKNIALFSPKRAEIHAGRDIADLFYYGQNLANTDSTNIFAGRNFTFSSAPTVDADSGHSNCRPRFASRPGGSFY